MKLNKKSLMIFLTAAMLVFTGCSNEKENGETTKNPPQEKAEDSAEKQSEEEKKVNTGADFIVKAAPQKIEHVHGIGYPGNDEGLYVASHQGLKIFKEGQWFEATDQNHDYMGFQAVNEGFYSSGHPEEGSDLKNPLGLVKSTDQGKSLEKVAFYGESDFHFLSASFQGDVIYLINEEPNSKLERGVYLSRDSGKNWLSVSLDGLESNSMGMMAVHPEKGGTLAMSTREGVFVSDDFGKTIKETGDYEMVTAAAFSKESLYISPVEQKTIKLVRLNAEKLEEAEELPLPKLNYDNPITYIAADPGQEGRIAFITILNDLYESEDGGKTWNQVLLNGRIK